VPNDEPRPGSPEQDVADREQTLSEADQGRADLDQTTSDADQSASDRDQRASDRDQRASDGDQMASDHALGDGADLGIYARNRRARAQATLERDAASMVRSQAARVRDITAERRDRDADQRDAAAAARDHYAVELDAEIDALDRAMRAADRDGNGHSAGMEILLRAAQDRRRAADSRARATTQRERAAHDRELARLDRDQAAADRRAAAEELAMEGVDHLTGVLRRRVGMIAIQREIERTARSGDDLVVAFVDVDGLQAVNNLHGHVAGDSVLRGVADCIRHALRAYDVVLRFGGDEFVCSLSGQSLDGAEQRFDQITARIAESLGGPTVSVGLAERALDEPLDTLVSRADLAMMASRAGR
jgi:diguanylate cyclase (GGDEF)-like protein